MHFNRCLLSDPAPPWLRGKGNYWYIYWHSLSPSFLLYHCHGAGRLIATWPRGYDPVLHGDIGNYSMIGTKKT